jgi:plasmid stabilization system protein ParE
MRVRYTLAAFAERDAIFEYLNERSPRAAREVVELITRRIAELGEYPHKGHKSDRRGIFTLWIAPMPYRVFYRIDDEDVVIVHIRHTARRPWRGGNR